MLDVFGKRVNEPTTERIRSGFVDRFRDREDISALIAPDASHCLDSFNRNRIRAVKLDHLAAGAIRGRLSLSVSEGRVIFFPFFPFFLLCPAVVPRLSRGCPSFCPAVVPTNLIFPVIANSYNKLRALSRCPVFGGDHFRAAKHA